MSAKTQFEIQTMAVHIDGHSWTSIFAVTHLGLIAGFVELEHKGKRIAGIRRLFVRPTSRRNGIATALLKYAATLARESDCIALSLEVAAESLSGTVVLYTNAGFLPSAEFSDGSIGFSLQL